MYMHSHTSFSINIIYFTISSSLEDMDSFIDCKTGHQTSCYWQSIFWGYFSFFSPISRPSFAFKLINMNKTSVNTIKILKVCHSCQAAKSIAVQIAISHYSSLDKSADTGTGRKCFGPKWLSVRMVDEAPTLHMMGFLLQNIVYHHTFNTSHKLRAFSS